MCASGSRKNMFAACRWWTRPGRLVGIVTEGDINRVSDLHITDVRDYSLYHRVADLPIGEIITRAVVTVTPDTPILVVARLLLDHRIGGVPVVEDGPLSA